MVKEGMALLYTLRAGRKILANCRVDARIDNMQIVAAWGGQGSKSSELNLVLKQLAEVCAERNLLLKMEYIPSADNEADGLSREVSKTDATLAPRVWERIQQLYGGLSGHTIDLMALDSNAMVDRLHEKLPHFTPWSTTDSNGINV